MSGPLSPTPRTRLRRARDKGRTDRAELAAVLRAGLVAHLGVVVDGTPMVVPTGYGFDDGHLYLHGSVASRSLAADAEVCVTVTVLDGLVLARSVFEHSMKYRCAMIYGVPRRVTDPDEKLHGLRLVSEHLAPGQWDYARRPSGRELAATVLLALPLDEASVKARSGPPDDGDGPDAALGRWAGELPATAGWAAPVPDPALPDPPPPVPAHLTARSGSGLDCYSPVPVDAATVVRVGDPRYPALRVGQNRRWTSRPDRICVVGSAEDVVREVQRAVDAGERLGVRGGNQGYRAFVHRPDTRVVLDLSELAGIAPDPGTGTIAVGGGARLGPVYETLHRRWGVTLPAGNCHEVGLGGHVPGGGFGLLSRRDGLVVDHLYGVEVVVVGADGTARGVRATREPDDPHRDLWWAHTGGGGGGFGVVTRFLFRSPGVPARLPPERLLPAAPGEVLVSTVFLPWDRIDEAAFARLVDNYTDWYRRHREPAPDSDPLAGYLVLSARAAGSVSLLTHHYGPDERVARAATAAYLDEMLAGTGLAPAPVRPYTAPVRPRRVPYPQALRMVSTGSAAMNDPSLRGEYKSAFLRGPLGPDRLAALHRHLSAADNPNAMVMLLPYGGRVSAVAAGATAAAHRDASVVLLAQTLWADPEQDEAQVGWARQLYADVVGDAPGGCYVNYPDTDLGDRWPELYFKDDYARLQRVKAAYDPLEVFRHPQSVRLPGGSAT